MILDIRRDNKSVSKIEKLVMEQSNEDQYILDQENAIIVINDREKQGYIMIHERLVDGKLKEINRWPIKSYYFGAICRVSTIKSLGLFKVQNNAGKFGSLYNYKEGKFVIPQGDWKLLEFGNNNSHIDKFDGVIGSFSIKSDYEKDDSYEYVNPLTGRSIRKTFSAYSDNYYAIINLDGTIRENKLFKGNDLEEITEIIDLDEYESLTEFKKHIKDECNKKKRQKKEDYKKLIESRNDGSISPYMDVEVAKVFMKKKEKED